MKSLLIVFLTVLTLLALVYLGDKTKFGLKMIAKLDDKLSTNGLFVLILVFWIFVINFANIPYVYSEGTKIGTLTKFHQKGLIFKTWEGQLNLGGVVSDGDGGMVANTWNFSVVDPEVIDKLKNTVGRVSVDYTQYILVPAYVGSTQYIIKDVR